MGFLVNLLYEPGEWMGWECERGIVPGNFN